MDDEYKANVLLYVYGMIHDLHKEGMVRGSDPISEQGYTKYLQLKADGFAPGRDFLESAIRFVINRGKRASRLN